jgi:hypothetical protein
MENLTLKKLEIVGHDVPPSAHNLDIMKKASQSVQQIINQINWHLSLQEDQSQLIIRREGNQM